MCASKIAPITSRARPVTRLAAASIESVAPSAMPKTSGTRTTGAWPEACTSAASQAITIAATVPATYQINMAMLRRAVECLRQIGDEIVWVLDATGHADHIIRDAVGAAIFRRALVV